MRRILPIILIAAALIAGIYTGYVRTQRQPAIAGPVLTVEFLGADCGDAIVLSAPGGAVTVVDPGPQETAARLAQYLIQNGISRVGVVITNPSSTRAGALETLLESLTVTCLMCGEADGRSRAWQRALQIADERKIPVVRLIGPGTVSLFAGVELEVLSPPSGLLPNADQDENSVVARITYRGVRFMLSSDSGSKAEGNLVSSGIDLACDVLVVGRHGQAGAASLELLRLVRPSAIVLSAGPDGYSPAASVLKRLDPKRTGADLYRTDQDGLVTFVTDGQSVVAHTGGIASE